MTIDVRKSKRKAIDEKCKDCIYDHLDKGTWRQQVDNCWDINCSLWWHRPTSRTYEGHEACHDKLVREREERAKKNGKS